MFLIFLWVIFACVSFYGDCEEVCGFTCGGCTSAVDYMPVNVRLRDILLPEGHAKHQHSF